MIISKPYPNTVRATSGDIGGLVVTHNCIELDYCFEAAVKSLLPICDQVVVCDSDSTDGTRQRLDEMASQDKRIEIVNATWNPPVDGKHHWFIEWLNFARSHLKTTWQMSLDADEVLHEDTHEIIRSASNAAHGLSFARHNFWKDSRQLSGGICCSDKVFRFGLQKLPTISDEPHPEGSPEMVKNAIDSKGEIFHYGFIRRKAAFYAKAKIMLKAWFGTYDDRLVQAESTGSGWHDLVISPDKLTPFSGSHPMAARGWLRDHGFPSWAISDRAGHGDESTRICAALAEGAESVCDLGCGEAHHTRKLANVTFVDVLPRPNAPEGMIKANIIEFADQCAKRFSVCFLLDVIEHLTKEDGARLLKQLENIADRIVVFTPSGELWMNNGDTPNDHRSGWTAKEFDELGYECWEWPQFHHWSDGGTFGAFWAWKDTRGNTPSAETISRKSSVPI